jgi:hypothetical protein
MLTKDDGAQQIDAIDSDQRWIRVEEALPGEEEPVLVVECEGYVTIGIIIGGKWLVDTPHEGCEPYEEIEVVMWRDIPEHP